MGNWKFENSMVIKKNSRSNLLSCTPKKLKKNNWSRTNEMMQSKNPWKSEFDILTKDSVWNIEKWTLKKCKK